MDDDFMLSAWRRPRAEFARKLRQNLDRVESEELVTQHPRPVARYLAYAATVLLVVGAFTLPSVRAGAQAFLDLFRVVHFAPVSVHADQMRKISPEKGMNLAKLLGDQVEVLKEPAPPKQLATIQEATAAAGVRIREPAWLPVGFQQVGIDVMDEHAMRVTLNSSTLNQLVDAFGIDDLRVPDSINGKTATVRVHPIVHIGYMRSGDNARKVSLMQGRSPEASLPAGLDLATLAEMGLRVLGMEKGEARRFAQSVDWRSTLVVPIPVEAASFRQIDVRGNQGLLIEMASRERSERHAEGPPVRHILWSAEGSVFALTGNVPAEELFEIAQNVQ